MFWQNTKKVTDNKQDFASWFPSEESYTREPPPVPEEMKNEICVWGFELTEATFGSHPLASIEEFYRTEFILRTCRELGIGPPKAQLTFGRKYVLGWAQHSPYASSDIPDVIPSAEKIEELRKKIHLEGEPKWVYRH